MSETRLRLRTGGVYLFGDAAQGGGEIWLGQTAEGEAERLRHGLGRGKGLGPGDRDAARLEP